MTLGGKGNINFVVVGCCVEVIYLLNQEMMAYLIQFLLLFVQIEGDCCL